MTSKLKVLAFLALCCLISVANAVSCSNGAEVEEAKYCAYFYHYNSKMNEADQRIAQRVGATADKRTRAIALIVGISVYSNMPQASINAAKVDVENLKSFLVDDQNFDEVIVLENKAATRESIDYFLKSYLPKRVATFGSRSRFLFAYSGHGIQAFGGLPPSFVLAQATSLSDASQLYDLTSLRGALENLSSSNFHVLALINSCYGGNIFGMGMIGGNPSVTDEPGSYALTAGPAEFPVATFGGPKDGSIFFDTIIKGVKTGDADRLYQRLVDENGKVFQEGGIVTLGGLANYLTATISATAPVRVAGSSSTVKLKAPWIGPVEPTTKIARGGFFFLTKIKQSDPTQTALIVSGPKSSVPGHPKVKVFGSYEEYPIKGIDASKFEGHIDWQKVKQKANINFAYLRAFGTTGIDSAFTQNLTKAREQNIDVGVYTIFSYCISPEEQLSRFTKVVPKIDSLLPPAIDVNIYDFASKEVKCAKSLSNKERLEKVFGFASALGIHYQKTPVIYGNRTTLNQYSDLRFEKFMFWLASYSKSALPTNQNITYKGSNPWTLWQYTGSADVIGIGKNVDMNVFFGNSSQYELFKAAKSNVAFTTVR